MSYTKGTLIHTASGKQIEDVERVSAGITFHVVRLAEEAEPNEFRKDEWEFRPALPTKPGIYRANNGPSDTKLESYKRLMLTTEGEWFWLDFTANYRATKGSHGVFTGPLPKDQVSKHTLTLVYGGAE